MINPVISIITVALNSEKYIESTITSVLAQNYKHIEFIVIDGGSNDSTLSILEKYKNNIDYYCSEPDNGIAEAMNKGVEAAHGDYLLFLNSDDYLANKNVINIVANSIAEKKNAIHIFKVRFLYEDGREILSLINGFSFLTNFKMGSCHQGQLFPRKLFKELGGFDTSLSINFDYDLLLRAYRRGAITQTYNDIIAVMRQVGISSRRDWAGFKERYNEEKIVHKKNCPGFTLNMLYQLYWLLYIPYRYFRYLLIAFNKKYIGNKTIKALQ